MTRIIGRLTSVGIAKEAVRGTALAPTFWVPVRDLDFDDNLDKKDNESGYGVIGSVSDAQIVKQWSEGSFSGKVMDKSIGVILTGLFGQSPTSVQRGSTGVYDHTFAMLNTNQHQSLCVAIKEANNNLRYANAVVDSFKIEAEVDDFIRYELNLMGKKGASGSDTIAYTAENEFIPKHIALTTAATYGGLPGTALGVRSFSLEINKNADTLQQLGSVDILDAVNKQLEISGSIELYYDATTQRDYVFNNTTKAMRLDILNSDTVIGSGSDNPELRFDLAKVNFGSWSRGFDNDDIMTQSIDFKGQYSISDGVMLAARLTNAYAGTNY